MKKNKMASTQSEKCFVRKREMYTLAEKKELGEYKEKYDKKLKNLEGKTNYDYKRAITVVFISNQVNHLLKLDLVYK